MTDPCYDGVIFYESPNSVWELVLERHEWIVDHVVPSLSNPKNQRFVEFKIEGITFGTRR
jgi:hypothetical protein